MLLRAVAMTQQLRKVMKCLISSQFQPKHQCQTSEAPIIDAMNMKGAAATDLYLG